MQIFNTVDDAKNYMTNRQPGLTARIIMIDITGLPETQTGPKSRRPCKAPSEAGVRAQVHMHTQTQIYKRTNRTNTCTRMCARA